MMNPNRLNQANNKQFRCCFGLLHVRTACICIGTWHLMLNLLAITLLAIIVKNPNMMENLDSSLDDESNALPTPVSNRVDNSYNKDYYRDRDHSMAYQDLDMGGLVCLCMIAITLMLIYGAIKGRPSHLLPFFFLQLCDFAITTLTAAGYLCYLRTIHKLIDSSQRLPWKDQIQKIDTRTLGVIVLFAFIFMVMLKAYCIGIVWRCYKYLTILQNANFLSCITPVDQIVNTDRSYNSLLPGYEEALNMKASPPPPSYSVAVSMEQNQFADITEPPSYQDTRDSTDEDIQSIRNDASPAHSPSQQQQPQQTQELPTTRVS